MAEVSYNKNKNKNNKQKSSVNKETKFILFPLCALITRKHVPTISTNVVKIELEFVNNVFKIKSVKGVHICPFEHKVNTYFSRSGIKNKMSIFNDNTDCDIDMCHENSGLKRMKNVFDKISSVLTEHKQMIHSEYWDIEEDIYNDNEINQLKTELITEIKEKK